MPRLEEGQLAVSAMRFKKRRAWITPDEESDQTKNQSLNGAKTAPAKSTVKHEYNKNDTRVEQECNKTTTRIEHGTPCSGAILEKEKTRRELDYNKSATRVEQECNKSKTSCASSELYNFVLLKRASMTSYEDEAKCQVLALSDVQRKIFWRIALRCIEKNTPRTGPIEIKKFFEDLEISTAVVRTTLNRLVSKEIVQREKGKLGKNGFAIIGLPRSMYDAAHEIFSEFQQR